MARLVMRDYARPEEEALKLTLYTIHESIGATIWALTLACLAWHRLSAQAEAMSADREFRRPAVAAIREHHMHRHAVGRTGPRSGGDPS
jgi:cytochrome b561